MGLKMLVIDDNGDVLETCSAICTHEGYEVVKTVDPEKGLRLISDSHFDVVLCDWQMPKFNGMDVVEEVDRISTESAIVMISAHPSVGRAAEAMKRGAMGYAPKPFTPAEIAVTVKKAIERKIIQEKKALGRFEKIVQNLQFPVPSLEDKAPQTIAATVAQKVGVVKTTSHWLSVFVLGILAGAYIGSVILAFLFFLSDLWKTGGSALGQAAVNIAYGKVSLGFWEAYLRPARSQR